jgi:pyridoxamine 5'-phosphate oxidase
MKWLVELSAALGAVQRNAPLIATLATVDWQGRPRARSVVCRRLADDGSVWIASDARSDKNVHAKEGKLGELVVWLPQPRQQFRLFGSLQVLDVTDPTGARLRMWQDLTDGSRALFFWPTPGASLDANPAAFPRGMPPETAPPESFEVLILRPTQVERLRLQPHPHERTRWSAEGDWAAEALNP